MLSPEKGVSVPEVAGRRGKIAVIPAVGKKEMKENNFEA